MLKRRSVRCITLVKAGSSKADAKKCFYLQCSAECLVLAVHQEQGGNSRIVQTKRCISDSLCLTRWPAHKEDGHLPHEETTPHSLEGVVSHKTHGIVQHAALVGLQRLQSFNVLQEGLFLHSICKADLSGHLIIVQCQSNAGPPWAVALRDGDVSDKAQDHVTHGIKALAAISLGNVQSEGQLSGVEWALLLT